MLVLYGFFLLFIFCYSLIQLSLVVKYKRSLGRTDVQALTMEEAYGSEENYPTVTIQLPVFNELYVVERLIDSVVSIRYPQDKLEIQLLDDSTDESFDIAAKSVAHWHNQGVNIVHVRRPQRTGFKAGALSYGLKRSLGEYTAIFDADFLPDPDFLEKTIPHFKDDNIGVVQTRWEHLNEDYSLLTRLQAFGLDAHFTVEQRGRNSANHFINFNGTAGVWRKTCIEDAGGWQSDTLTEDLDLSYRAQLKGWKFKYLERVGSPAELPAAMNALKNQQYRWTKGAAECTVKNLPRVLKASGLGFGTKLQALFHLMNSFIFICIISTAILSVPMLWIKDQNPQFDILFKLASIFLLSFVILSYFYWTSSRHGPVSNQKSFGEFLMLFPMFLSVSMGLSLHNAIAVIEGYVGRKTPFVRTPKFDIQKADDSFSSNKYRITKIHPLTFIEGLLTLYFLFGMGLAFYLKDFGLVPFHLMLFFGFGIVSFYSIRHARM
jgi:cellulose synthase/poly-beta-1,6-N-acetylglucosamine synthase-like glycosyltransferase